MSRRKTTSAKGPSQRQLRVGELIRHKLAEMLARGEIYDDVLASHVTTITEVRMSPDLRLATAYVMPSVPCSAFTSPRMPFALSR